MTPQPHVLAQKDGIMLVGLLLLGSGAQCRRCGYGTRATSKNWARCKRCGERVRRIPMEEVAATIKGDVDEVTR